MAKISATEFFRFENFDPEIIGKRVGHNRTVSHARRERGRTIIGSLHGHPVFELCELAEKPGHYEVRFDTCGWTTVTTRQAMTD
ncbi:MAG: hypothetical protein MJH10_11090, partial [Epibacterium sp.]|nr:hypothetical protein [Epibacterium sp.]NQX74090.1 hypothetical protein [Epibacterium sp.]